MLDPVARRQAAELLRRFQARELTNDDLEHAWPESDDLAVKEVFDAIWGTLDDLHEHRYEPSPSTDDLFRRCIEFLDADFEYSWPVPNPWLRLLSLPLSIVTFGLANRLLWRKYRFPDYWPFASSETGAAARKEHPGN